MITQDIERVELEKVRTDIKAQMKTLQGRIDAWDFYGAQCDLDELQGSLLRAHDLNMKEMER